MLKHLASFFSFIFSPLLVATYAVAVACRVSMLVVLPAAILWKITAIVFGITCVMPMLAIALLFRLKLVSSPGLNNQNERTIPYIVSALSYAALVWFFARIQAPGWLTMFAVGALAAIVVACVVNFRWKISVHLTAMGGLLGLMTRLIVSQDALVNPFPWFIAIIIATGVVASSRLYLNRHTLGQVAAGTLNGFLCVFLFTAIHL